jgi:iron complex transport system substrate-binding protein
MIRGGRLSAALASRSARRVGVGLLSLLTAAGAGAAPIGTPAPQRIASLNLASDEILVEILPAQRLVAVTAVSDEPGTSNIAGRIPPSVPRFRRAELERLVTLSPDLVVVSEYTDADFLTLLERSGLHFHRMEGLRSLEGVRRAILDLGRAVGALPAAEALVTRYDSVLAELKSRLAGARRPRVLYWSDPMTAGADTAISAVIEAAGGASVGKEMGLSGILPVGVERVFLADPDYVLVGAFPGARTSLADHPLLGKMRAVREGRIIEMPNQLLMTLSQHLADACWSLGSALHPDRVSPRP